MSRRCFVAWASNLTLRAASLMMAAAILPCSHAGEEAVLRRMGVEYGVACCIADDGCGHSAVLSRASNLALRAASPMIAAAILPCSHAREQAVLRCMGVNLALLAASLMMAVATPPCSHAGEQAVRRRKGIKHGVACCIDHDVSLGRALTLVRSRCFVTWASNMMLLAPSLMMAAAILCVLIS